MAPKKVDVTKHRTVDPMNWVKAEIANPTWKDYDEGDGAVTIVAVITSSLEGVTDIRGALEQAKGSGVVNAISVNRRIPSREGWKPERL